MFFFCIRKTTINTTRILVQSPPTTTHHYPLSTIISHNHSPLSPLYNHLPQPLTTIPSLQSSPTTTHHNLLPQSFHELTYKLPTSTSTLHIHQLYTDAMEVCATDHQATKLSLPSHLHSRSLPRNIIFNLNSIYYFQI